MDLQRNPKNIGEVRLLYHRVVAPTQGVLGWAGGDSMSFDLVFTGVESMDFSDVRELVKARRKNEGFVSYFDTCVSFRLVVTHNLCSNLCMHVSIVVCCISRDSMAQPYICRCRCASFERNPKVTLVVAVAVLL